MIQDGISLFMKCTFVTRTILFRYQDCVFDGIYFHRIDKRWVDQWGTGGRIFDAQWLLWDLSFWFSKILNILEPKTIYFRFWLLLILYLKYDGCWPYKIGTLVRSISFHYLFTSCLISYEKPTDSFEDLENLDKVFTYFNLFWLSNYL